MINSTRAKVLSDSGANRYFMTPSFVAKLHVKAKLLNCALLVDTANNSEVKVREGFENCMICIEDCEVPIRLFPLALIEFDVVVGMDWLAENQAKIVCNKKLFNVLLPDGKSIVIYGDGSNRQSSLISVIEARKCVNKGCQSYLAYLIDVKTEESKLEDIPIISDFLEVFPINLISLPPDRPVEFGIYLIPRAAPIARAPYRLAPLEMKEMISQLQDLSNKGIIRPSSFVVGCTSVVCKEERWLDENVYRLLGVEQAYDK